MSELRERPALYKITEGIAFFLCGAFLIGTSAAVSNTDILIQRLTPFTHFTGYVLLGFGVVYILPLIPWFKYIQKTLNKISVYVYPFVFAIASLQVLRIAIDPNQNEILRWASIGFLVLISFLIMFTPFGKVTEKRRLLLSLLLAYNGLAIVIIAVRAKNPLALMQSPNVEPLILLFASFVCGIFLVFQMRKKDEPK